MILSLIRCEWALVADHKGEIYREICKMVKKGKESHHGASPIRELLYEEVWGAEASKACVGTVADELCGDNYGWHTHFSPKLENEFVLPWLLQIQFASRCGMMDKIFLNKRMRNIIFEREIV
jgi:hypothetical protein